MKQISPIAHISLQSFFASVEQAAHPTVAHRPVAVTDARREKIVSVSPEARRLGITKGMALIDAMNKRSSITYLTGAIDLYQKYSERFFKLVYEVTDRVEPLTLDQAYLTFPDTTWRSAQATLLALQKKVADELGLTLRAGLATNKITAYLASRHGKNSITTIGPGRERLFLNTLPLHALPSIGSRTAQVLAQYGILTLRQLALAPTNLLVAEFGQHGIQLQQFARGDDSRDVTPAFDQRTLSRSSDAITPTINIMSISQIADQAIARLSEACESTSQALKQITVVVMTPDGQHSHTIELKHYTIDQSVLRTAVFQALPSLIKRSLVTQIRLQAVDLRTNTEAGSFFQNTVASFATIRHSLHFLYHQFGWRAPAL